MEDVGRPGELALAVVADDRTGALETAGECADAGAGPVLVTTTLGDRPVAGGRCVVVDLGTRHLDADAARRIVVRADRIDARRHAHKFDSGLRGNWAAELVARHRAAQWRVLVVPANPAVGRTCVDGVVLLDESPVHEAATGDDALDPVTSSRPAEHLTRAAAPDVVVLTSSDGLREWLSGSGPDFAVCDARTNDDLRTIAELWDGADGVLFAGTAASIGAAAGALNGGMWRVTSQPAAPGPVLVVCGSVHEAARRQVGALAARGVAVGVVSDPSAARLVLDMTDERPGLLQTPMPASLPVDADDAAAMAAALADAAHRLWSARDPAVVVIIGGDTAAAVLGDEPLVVRGTVGAGTPIGWRLGFGPPAIVTRSGAFGADDALIRLVEALRAGHQPT